MRVSSIRIRWFVYCCLIGTTASIAAQTTRPAPSTQPSSTTQPARAYSRTAIKDAIRELIAEAQLAVREQKLTVTPNFAKRFQGDLPLKDLQEALIKPVHADPFIDAYVRWQLTSFNPDLPDLDDQRFLQFLAIAPTMIANPRADESTVKTLQDAEKSGRLAPSDLQRFRDARAELDRRTKIAEAFNRPAAEFREWVASKRPEFGHHHLLCAIEQCHAAIAAGWPSRTTKSRLTKLFKSAGATGSITPTQRQLIVEHARLLVGPKRVSVNEITFKADGSLSATFTTAAVTEDDVAQWIGYISTPAP